MCNNKLSDLPDSLRLDERNFKDIEREKEYIIRKELSDIISKQYYIICLQNKTEKRYRSIVYMLLPTVILLLIQFIWEHIIK